MTTGKKAVKEPVIEEPDIGSTPMRLFLIKKQSGWEEQERKWIAFFLGIAWGLVISKLARNVYDSEKKAGPAEKKEVDQKAGR